MMSCEEDAAARIMNRSSVSAVVVIVSRDEMKNIACLRIRQPVAMDASPWRQTDTDELLGAVT